MKDYLMGTKFRQGRGDAGRERWPSPCHRCPERGSVPERARSPLTCLQSWSLLTSFPAAMTSSYPSMPPLCAQGLEGRESSALGDTAPVEGFPSKEHDLRLCAEDGGLCRHWQSIPCPYSETQRLAVAELGLLNAQLPAVP